MTLDDTFKLDDEEETGYVTYSEFIDSLESVETEIEKDLLDFASFLAYRNSGAGTS
jgi:Ca2+-binding EF-hand superfamily protein